MPTLQLQLGDCVERMSTIEPESVGFIISDPPYGLKFMGYGFDDLGDGKRQREWHRRWLIEAHRILKPNGVIKAFGGTRTFHHLAAAMRSVGFRNIRVEPWGYGSGFPKSLSISSALDKSARGTPQGSTKGDPRERGVGVLPPRNVLSMGGKNGKSPTGLTNNYSTNVIETDEARTWDGWGTNLKPAWEPIVIGEK